MVEAKLSNGRARSTWPLYLLFFVVAGTVAAVLGLAFVGDSLAALGIPDPGPLTTGGLPFLRAGAWFLAALAMGSFLASAFFIKPQGERLHGAPLTVDGVIAAKTGWVATLCFALIGLAMIPLTLSDISGTPLKTVLGPAAWGTSISNVSTAKAWLASTIFALILLVGSAIGRNWSWQPVWVIGAFLLILPLGLEGHSAAGGDHDYGTNSLLLHLLFMLLWVGGLAGLIAHGRRLGPHMSLAVQRYSAIALVCMLAMTGTGLINAAIRVRPEDLFTVAYGGTVVAKVVLTVALAVFGFIHRTKTMPKLAQGSSKAFLRVSIVEVLVMAATIGVAASMGRTPPPPPRVFNLSKMALEMGYEVPKAPTFWGVWTVWRYDLMFTTFGIIIAAMYIWGLVTLRRKGKPWPWQRTFWFMLGSVGMAIAMSSGVGLYMPAMFSMHMVTHMVLSMVIPVFLVLGAPVQLALDALPANPDYPGPREWIEALLESRTLRFLMHPAFNTIQFITIFYLLYVTPLYDLMVSEHAGHLIMNWVFLGSGYLYFWEMIGWDPKPKEHSVVSRLAWLIFSMPFHLYFGVYLMQLSEILAFEFYSTLDLPYPVDLMQDQNVGGGIAWASGSFPLVVVFGTLFVQWLREDRKEMAAIDEREEETGVDPMDAYNEMLARLNDPSRRG